MKKITLFLGLMLFASTLFAQTFKVISTTTFQAFVGEEYHISDTLEITGTRYFYKENEESDQMDALVECKFKYRANGITTELTAYCDLGQVFVLATVNPTDSIHYEWDQYLFEEADYDYLFEVTDVNLRKFVSENLPLHIQEYFSDFLWGMEFENDKLMRIQDQK